LVHTASPAQFYPAPVALDKNDPDLRAILTEIEADAENALYRPQSYLEVVQKEKMK
jgi:hypothetical protein